MGFFTDLVSDIISAPFVVAAVVVDTTITAVASIPDIAEATVDKIEKAVNKIG
jgi:hypothetical protein